MKLFSITKSARGRPRKGEVKEERYKRKKDRHRKPLVQLKLDENLYNQHKVTLTMCPYTFKVVIFKILRMVSAHLYYVPRN